MTQENTMEQNHSLKITSSRARENRDIDDVGLLVLKNGVTGKEHGITMWGEGIEEEALSNISLYMNEPEEIIRLLGEDMSVDGAASDALTDYSLNDLIKTEEELWPDIEQYGLGKTENYEHDIPLKDLHVDLHELIVKEEITDLIMKNARAALTKEDVLNFGELVKSDAVSYQLGSEFKTPIQSILNENSFDARELAVINSASQSLNADINFTSFVASKEILQNMKGPGAIDFKEKSHPKEFLEKFQELNAIEPKLLLNEDRETGMIAMGILLEKEILDPSDNYEFVQLSKMEVSSFDYNSAIREKMDEGKDLGNLHVESLADRSEELCSTKHILINAGMSPNEAKEFILENSQDTVVNWDRINTFMVNKGLDTSIDDWELESGMYKLEYDLGTGDKHIKIKEEVKDSSVKAPSYNFRGEDMASADSEDDVPTKTIFYEFNEKDLTFIDGKTKQEYPLKKILSKQQFQNVKESVDSRESISINLDSQCAKTIKNLTKDHPKSFSANKVLSTSKEEIEHSR